MDDLSSDLDDSWESQSQPIVRPFFLTRGRTDTNLPLEAMVVTVDNGRARVDCAREQRAIIELCSNPMAVAEISVHTKLPLGVVRVLVSDLVDDGLLLLADGTPNDDLDFIDRIIRAVELL